MPDPTTSTRPPDDGIREAESVLGSPGMPTRYDTTSVPLQGGYIAKQCPVVAHLANDPTLEVVVLDRPDDAQLRIDRGIEFEAEIIAELVALHPEGIVVDRSAPPVDREAATRAAMEAQAGLIIGGRLSPDIHGKRVGEPDLLVSMSEPDGRTSYLPVDVKHHLTIEEGSGAAMVEVSPLAAPRPDHAAPEAGSLRKSREDDALQLAHYHRMLEAAGFAHTNPTGGIIGKEHRVVWYDLTEPMWKSGGRTRTTLERYDFEFDFRLDIIAVARQRGDDPSLEPLVVPVRIADCDSCDWWEVCRPVLESKDDVSLLPRIGWPQWRDLHLGAITTTEQLASLDWETADLIARGVDLRTYVNRAPDFPPSAPVADVIGKRRTKQIADLELAGFSTAGDALRLDGSTIDVAYARGDAPLKSLAAHIDTARARLGPAPAYRRRGIEDVLVPRADVEIDIDMENTIDEDAYLWGALVTDPSGRTYHPFVTWEPMDAGGGARREVFDGFWNWLSGQIETNSAAGRTVAVYCYSSQAEERHMRRGLAEDDAGQVESVEALIRSERWIDMRKVFERQLITGSGSGLKVVAGLAGFRWRDDDPGGGRSMVWYEQAVAGDEAARMRLLAYNEDDVLATARLRAWMDESSFPSIASAS